MNSVILEGDTGFVSGGLQPPLAVGASQVCQRASLLEPPVHTHLDVTVDVPARDSIYYVKCDNNSRFRMLNLVVDRKMFISYLLAACTLRHCTFLKL